MSDQQSRPEYGWVIERDSSHGIAYAASVLGVLGWSFDHRDAIRFAREQDARAIADLYAPEADRVAEHAWDKETV